MKTIIILILTFLVFISGLAQDIIVTKAGDTVICKITKVDTSQIMFSMRRKDGRRINTFISKEKVNNYKYGFIMRKADTWIDIGLGACIFIGGRGMLSVGINLSNQIKRSLISLRYIHNFELNILGDSPSESVSDFGALYGRLAKASYGFASISGGVSYVGGVRRGRLISSSGGWFSTGNYEKMTFNTVGIPIEGQLFWTPTSRLGIGIYGFANMNNEKSFFGGLLSIQLFLD